MSRNFEDELRAVMRAHEDEAPSNEVLRVPARRAPRWLPVAAAAVVVLAVGGVVAVTSHRGGSSPAAKPTSSAAPRTLHCPAPVKQTEPIRDQVPTTPQGVHAQDRLVPDQTPQSVLLCGWIRSDGPTKFRSRVLAGGTSRLITDLGFAPKGGLTNCATYLARTDADTFLIGLTYASGTVWVTAPGNHCDGSSNGTFISSSNFSVQVRSALSTGAWPIPRNPAAGKRCATNVATGRRGQEQDMVPGTPTHLAVCVTHQAQGKYVRTEQDFTDGFGDLVTELNRVSTHSSERTCDGSLSGDTFVLLIGYGTGPDVYISILPGCHPSIDNGSLASSDDTAVLRELHKVLGH